MKLQTKHARPGLSTEQKAALCQAVAIGGASEGDYEAVVAAARRYGDVTSIDRQVSSAVAAFAKLPQDGCHGDAMIMHYKGVKQAMEAVWKLHRQRLKSGNNSITLWARQVNGEGGNVRNSALLDRDAGTETCDGSLCAPASRSHAWHAYDAACTCQAHAVCLVAVV